MCKMGVMSKAFFFVETTFTILENWKSMIKYVYNIYV